MAFSASQEHSKLKLALLDSALQKKIGQGSHHRGLFSALSINRACTWCFYKTDKKDLSMNVFIVYAHPSEDSFTRYVRDSFIEGLTAAGHSYIISDLYKMGFNTDMSEAEYYREANYRDDLLLPNDVATEQNKINSCDALVFIYPVFWTEAPAKLLGWFNRVWTYGFAYGNRSMKQLKKALILCTAGHSLQHLKEYGHYNAMKTVMLGDRLFDRAKEKAFIILDSTAKSDMKVREANWDKHLKTAFEAGHSL
ncbi:MAG: NAD(P)H-dependent oxidoreductase [Eubacteriaceae bacterium]|nr:NAD(P)H-dependent oxidoreductase [Eubacteriaceae bacterium]